MKAKLISGLAIFMALMMLMSMPVAATDDFSEFQKEVSNNSEDAASVDNFGNLYSAENSQSTPVFRKTPNDGSSSWTFSGKGGGIIGASATDAVGNFVFVEDRETITSIRKLNATDGSPEGIFDFTDNGGVSSLSYYENSNGNGRLLVTRQNDDVTLIDTTDMSLVATTSESDLRDGVVNENTGEIYLQDGSGNVIYYDSNLNRIRETSLGGSFNRGLTVNSTSGKVFAATSSPKVYRLSSDITTIEQQTSSGTIANSIDDIQILDTGNLVVGTRSTNGYTLLDETDIDIRLDRVDKPERPRHLDANDRFLAFDDDQTTDSSAVYQVENPPAVQSVDITIDGEDVLYENNGTTTFQATVIASFDDGTTEDVTDDATYSDFDTSIIQHNGNGEFQGVGGGQTTINASYTGPNGNTESDTIDVKNFYLESVDFQPAQTTARTTENVDFKVIANYENLPDTRNVTENVDDTNFLVTSSRTGTASSFEFDFVNNTFSASEAATYTVDTSYTEAGVTGQEDSDTIEINPQLRYEDYSQLSGPSQIFLIFSDWSILAMLGSVLVGGMAGLKYGTSAGIFTFTAMTVFIWVGGFVSIFVPATLILFEIFMITVLDAQMVNFS